MIRSRLAAHKSLFPGEELVIVHVNSLTEQAALDVFCSDILTCYFKVVLFLSKAKYTQKTCLGDIKARNNVALSI